MDTFPNESPINKHQNQSAASGRLEIVLPKAVSIRRNCKSC